MQKGKAFSQSLSLSHRTGTGNIETERKDKQNIKKDRKKERMKERQKERKKERKKECKGEDRRREVNITYGKRRVEKR